VIIEPDVFWSDIALGVVCIVLGVLLRHNRNMWSSVFFTLALATFFGAAYHGFINTTSVWWGDLLWTITLFWFALTSVVMIYLSYGRRRSMGPWLIAGLLSYMLWAVLISEAFIWALLLQFIAIVTLSVRYVSVFRRSRTYKDRRILDMLLVAFVVLNIVAIALQQFKINFDLPISHNTVFHILELPVMVALFLFLARLSSARR
jgi:hypothetical protein